MSVAKEEVVDDCTETQSSVDICTSISVQRWISVPLPRSDTQTVFNMIGVKITSPLVLESVETVETLARTERESFMRTPRVKSTGGNKADERRACSHVMV